MVISMVVITVRTVRNVMVGLAFAAACAGIVALFAVTPHVSMVVP